MVKKSRSVSAKLTPDEYREVAARAQQAGLSLTQYTRRELLAGVALSPDARLLVGELLAFKEQMLQLSLAHEGITRELVQKTGRTAEDRRELLVADVLQKHATPRPLRDRFGASKSGVTA